MKNTNKRRHDPETKDMSVLQPATAFSSLPPELDTFMRGQQEGTSDSYYRQGPVEFCAWGYPLDLGNY